MIAFKKLIPSIKSIKKNIKIKPVLDAAKPVFAVFARAAALILKAAVTVLLIIVFTGVICVAVFGLYVKAYLLPRANIDIGNINMNLTSVIYYKDSETGQQVELTRLYGSENRVWVNYSEIPQDLIDAVIAIEDERFESHKGFDWKRTLAAAVNVVMPFSGNFGGSTITQQLVKNLTEENEITIQRKVLEILRALNLERKLTKEQIMEMYLNTINLSQGCYGVSSAAYVYFGKEVKDLTLAECACLAGITNSPTYYDPFQNRDNNKGRQELILAKMLQLGKITKEEYRQALNEKLNFRNPSEEQEEKSSNVQSYFIDFLITEIISELQAKYGYSETIAYKMLYAGGLTIEATIDPKVQAEVEKIYNDRKNFPSVKGTTQLESAAVVYSTDGRLLAMVGGIGAKPGNLVFNRALSKRQTGSATKPVTVFAPALEYGYITPYSVWDDSPPFLIDENGIVYTPEQVVKEKQKEKEQEKEEKKKFTAWPANSTRIYTGHQTIKTAVAKSINAVAVRVLDKLTPEVSFEFATKNLGLDLIREKTINGKTYTDIGYSALALGGYSEGVSLLQLTAAYVPFVNNGYYREPTSFTRVLDSEGNVLLDNTDNEHYAMSPKTAYYMRSILEAVVSEGTGSNAIISGYGVAGKTGTTSKNYDRWFIGMTPYYVAGIWYGFDINKEILLNVNPAPGTWKNVMTALLADKEKARFVDPEGLETYSYCRDSGNTPKEACKHDIRGSRVAYGKFFPEDRPTKTCEKHQFVNLCTESGKIASPFCPESALNRVSMLRLYRYFAIPGVAVSDEKYCVHYPEDLTPDILANYYPAYGSGAVDGYCNIHMHTDPWVTGEESGGASSTHTETEWEPPLITNIN